MQKKMSKLSGSKNVLLLFVLLPFMACQRNSGYGPYVSSSIEVMDSIVRGFDGGSFVKNTEPEIISKYENDSIGYHLINSITDDEIKNRCRNSLDLFMSASESEEKRFWLYDFLHWIKLGQEIARCKHSLVPIIRVYRGPESDTVRGEVYHAINLVEGDRCFLLDKDGRHELEKTSNWSFYFETPRSKIENETIMVSTFKMENGEVANFMAETLVGED